MCREKFKPVLLTTVDAQYIRIIVTCNFLRFSWKFKMHNVGLQVLKSNVLNYSFMLWFNNKLLHASILLVFVGVDFNHESGLPQGPAFLLLCRHDLPRLHLLWVDCTGAIP